MSAADDQAARAVLVAAWRGFKGPPPTPVQLQSVQAIAHLEGGPTYGGGHHNWGGIQCTAARGPSGECAEGCFASTDSHADGTPYAACFRSYPTADEGAADLVRLLLAKGLRGALASGNATELAHAMHAKRYFELDPDEYAKRIAGRAVIVAKSLGEPVLLRLPLAVASSTDDLFPWLAVGAAIWWAYRNHPGWFRAR